MRKRGEESRSALEAELSENCKKIARLSTSTKLNDVQLDKALKEVASELDATKKENAIRQAYKDVLELQIELYKGLSSSLKKRQRCSEPTFCHPSKTKTKLISHLNDLHQRKQDSRYLIASEILENHHIKKTDEFKLLLSQIDYNKHILDVIEMDKLSRKRINDLEKAYFAAGLESTGKLSKKEEEELVELNFKLEELQKDYEHAREESHKISDINQKIKEAQTRLELVKTERDRIEQELQERANLQKQQEEELFEAEITNKQCQIRDLNESNAELEHKIIYLKQLTFDVQQVRYDNDSQLRSIEEDIEIVNGPLSDMVKEFGSDPFSDPLVQEIIKGLADEPFMDVAAVVAAGGEERREGSVRRMRESYRELEAAERMHMESLRRKQSEVRELQRRLIRPRLIDLSLFDLSGVLETENALVVLMREFVLEATFARRRVMKVVNTAEFFGRKAMADDQINDKTGKFASSFVLPFPNDRYLKDAVATRPLELVIIRHSRGSKEEKGRCLISLAPLLADPTGMTARARIIRDGAEVGQVTVMAVFSRNFV